MMMTSCARCHSFARAIAFIVGLLVAVPMSAPVASKVNTKVLGDTSDDLVYTPVTPCRIVDTRFGAGGTLLAGQTRNWIAANPAGNFGSQGGAATNCGIPVKPAGVMANITVF